MPTPRTSSSLTSLAGHPAAIVVACLVALALTAGSVDDGLSRDDLVHLHMVRGDDPLVPPSKLDLFRTYQDDPRLLSARTEAGVYPWFADPAVRLAFFRPLASATHALDYALLPNRPRWMHLQNLAWYAVLVALAGLLYRRLAGVPWIGGIACILFAVDETHGGSVGWIAGRNGLMAAAFGLGAVLSHDIGLRNDHKLARVLSPVALGLSLLSSELGLGAVAMLFSYALWLQDERWPDRLRRLLPHLAVLGAWVVAYWTLGYGARGSGYYVDPVADPWLFARSLFWNLPKLVGMLLGPPTFTGGARWRSLAEVLYVPVVLLSIGAYALAVARSRTARFFATGSLLSILPVCGTMPDGRLLLLASFGTVGVTAELIAAAVTRPRVAWLPRWAYVPVVVTAGLLVVTRGVLSPLAMPGSASALAAAQQQERAARRSAPVPADLRERALILLNAPNAFVAALWSVGEAQDDPVPRQIRGLYFGPGRVTVYRADERTIVVTPSAGVLSVPVSWLSRRPGSFRQAGQVFALSDVQARVERVTVDGRPSTVTFGFSAPIDTERDVWLAWHAGRWYRYPVPGVGETATWEP